MNTRYSSHPNNRPIYGVPKELRHIIQVALGPQSDWINAGHAFGGYIVSQWPKDEVIEHLYEPLHMTMAFYDEHRDDVTNRILTLAWVQVRFPDVIECIPRQHLLDFIDGVYKKLFTRGYWRSPYIYDPDEANRSA